MHACSVVLVGHSQGLLGFGWHHGEAPLEGGLVESEWIPWWTRRRHRLPVQPPGKQKIPSEVSCRSMQTSYRQTQQHSEWNFWNVENKQNYVKAVMSVKYLLLIYSLRALNPFSKEAKTTKVIVKTSFFHLCRFHQPFLSWHFKMCLKTCRCKLRVEVTNYIHTDFQSQGHFCNAFHFKEAGRSLEPRLKSPLWFLSTLLDIRFLF